MIDCPPFGCIKHGSEARERRRAGGPTVASVSEWDAGAILPRPDLLNQRRLETRRAAGVQASIEVCSGLSMLVTQMLLHQQVAAWNLVQNELCHDVPELMPSDLYPKMPLARAVDEPRNSRWEFRMTSTVVEQEPCAYSDKRLQDLGPVGPNHSCDLGR